MTTHLVFISEQPQAKETAVEERRLKYIPCHGHLPRTEFQPPTILGFRESATNVKALTCCSAAC